MGRASKLTVIKIGQIKFSYTTEESVRIENKDGDLKPQIEQYLRLHFDYGFWGLEEEFTDSIRQTLKGISKLEKRTHNPLLVAHAADYVFNSFTTYWLDNIKRGRHVQAKHLWIGIIKLTKEAERSAKGRIHKGSPYYFLGSTYLDEHDTEIAFNYLHEAVEEDKLLEKSTNGKARFIDAPAFKTISLRKEKNNLLGMAIELIRNNFLDAYLSRYNQTVGDTLKLSIIDKKMLQNPDFDEETFALAHLLFWLYRWFNVKPMLSKNNSFADFSIMRMQSTLAGIIEQLLRHTYKQRYFRNNLCSLYAEEASVTLNVAKKTLDAFINTFGDWEKAFNKSLIASLKNDPALNPIIKDPRITILMIAYQIRNHCAHRLTATRAIARNSERITAILFSALFIIVKKLK